MVGTEADGPKFKSASDHPTWRKKNVPTLLTPTPTLNNSWNTQQAHTGIHLNDHYSDGNSVISVTLKLLYPQSPRTPSPIFVTNNAVCQTELTHRRSRPSQSLSLWISWTTKHFMASWLIITNTQTNICQGSQTEKQAYLFTSISNIPLSFKIKLTILQGKVERSLDVSWKRKEKKIRFVCEHIQYLNPPGPRPATALSLRNPMRREATVSNDPGIQL